MAQEEKFEEAKRLYEDANDDQKYILEQLFPELKESDDERIRKALIKYFRNCVSLAGINGEDISNWLEKQGKEECALKSFKDEDVRKFQQYIEKQAKAYEFNLPNRGYDMYAFAKDILTWLEKQCGPMTGIRKYVALSIMNFLDRNTLGMNLSAMECADLVNAVMDLDWPKVYDYMKKKLEKQGENSVCKVKIGEVYKCIASPAYTCFRAGDIYHVKDKFIAELINICSSCFVLLEKQVIS